MSTNPESAAVEAVAEVIGDAFHGKTYSQWIGTNAVFQIGTKLYPQSAIDALRGEVAMLRDALHIETHKVITCGVAASHPDASLSRRMEYAGKWDSPQAQEVRALRDKADAAERRVAELEAAISGVVLAFEQLGEAKGIVAERSARRSCETTMAVMKNALTKESP